MEATVQPPFQAPAQPQSEASTAQVKTNLHRLVDELDNAEILRAIEVILQTALPPAPLPEDRAVNLDELSPAERAAVEDGLRQLDAGQGIPHAQVWAEIEAKYGLKYPR